MNSMVHDSLSFIYHSFFFYRKWSCHYYFVCGCSSTSCGSGVCNCDYEEKEVRKVFLLCRLLSCTGCYLISITDHAYLCDLNILYLFDRLQKGMA